MLIILRKDHYYSNRTNKDPLLDLKVQNNYNITINKQKWLTIKFIMIKVYIKECNNLIIFIKETKIYLMKN